MKSDLSPPPTSKWSVASLSNLVQIIALVVAGIWGGYTFVYQDQIKPLLGTPDLQVKTTLTKIGSKGETVAVKLSLQLHNSGQMRIRMLAVAYNVVGYRVNERKQPTPLDTAKTLKTKSSSSLFYEERYYEKDGISLLNRFVLLLAGSSEQAGGTIFIEPNGSSYIDRIIYVNRNKFDAIQVRARYLFTKNQEKAFPVKVENWDEYGYLTIQSLESCDSFDSPNCLIGTEDSNSLPLW